MISDGTKNLQMVPFVVRFFFLVSLAPAETVDPESKRTLPAVDGAIEVFRKLLGRGLLGCGLFFLSLPISEGRAVGGLRYFGL